MQPLNKVQIDVTISHLPYITCSATTAREFYQEHTTVQRSSHARTVYIQLKDIPVSGASVSTAHMCMHTHQSPEHALCLCTRAVTMQRVHLTYLVRMQKQFHFHPELCTVVCQMVLWFRGRRESLQTQAHTTRSCMRMMKPIAITSKSVRKCYWKIYQWFEHITKPVKNWDSILGGGSDLKLTYTLKMFTRQAAIKTHALNEPLYNGITSECKALWGEPGEAPSFAILAYTAQAFLFVSCGV